MTREPRTEPCSCPCCRVCHRYIEGPAAGRCIYGGPFRDYVKLYEGDPWHQGGVDLEETGGR